MNGLQQQLGDGFNFVVYDMDKRAERDEAQKRFNQTNFPSYVVLDGAGKVIHRLIGEQSEANLRDAMIRAGGKAP